VIVREEADQICPGKKAICVGDYFMSTWFRLLVIMLAAQSIAEARLGETFEQCVTRYGPLIRQVGKPDNPQFIFEKDGITVGINFLDGKAAQISYSRARGAPITELEVQQLLEVNSNGSKWQYDEAESQRLRTSTYSKRECFKRDDGGAKAEHLVISQLGTHFLNITSSEYEKAIGSKNLQGF
jgi:hypothetical protein